MVEKNTNEQKIDKESKFQYFKKSWGISLLLIFAIILMLTMPMIK